MGLMYGPSDGFFFRSFFASFFFFWVFGILGFIGLQKFEEQGPNSILRGLISNFCVMLILHTISENWKSWGRGGVSAPPPNPCNVYVKFFSYM